MCRFILYQGPPLVVATLTTDPENSLIHQSFQSELREEPLNGDGFGLAWYVPEIRPEPALFRSISPAWSNQNLRNLSEVTRTRVLLAHVRAATSGLGVAETNTHPFTWRRYAFMHNGEVGSFGKLRRKLLDALDDEAFELIRGTTDSEHLFALFAQQVLEQGEAQTADELASRLQAAIKRLYELASDAGMTEPQYLNLALSNGSASVGCRITSDDPARASSLFVHAGKRYVCEAGVCRMVAPDDAGHAVILASEPLSTDPGWEAVNAGEFVLIEHDGGVIRRAAVLK